MPNRLNTMMEGPGGGLYFGDASMACCAMPRELKLASIIAGAPQFCQDDIEEQLFLRSLDGLRSYISDEELN